MATTANQLKQNLHTPIIIQNVIIAHQEADGYTRLTTNGNDQITKALEQNNEALALALLGPLKIKNDGMEIVNQRFLTFIKLAIDTKQEKILEKLLQLCVDINRYDYAFMLNQRARTGKIILLYAIEQGANSKMVELLIHYGAKCTQKWAPDQDASSNSIVKALQNNEKLGKKEVNLDSKDKMDRQAVQVKTKKETMIFSGIAGAVAAVAAVKQTKKPSSMVDQKNAAIKLRSFFKKLSEEKKKLIQKTHWGTGSNGHTVLLGLPHTKQTLKPTGILLSEGIAPMGGELGNGIGIDGVNQTALSGVGVDYFGEAWKYANLPHIPLEELEKSTIQFLQRNIDDFHKTKASASASNILCRINLAVLNLRQINEKIYQDQFAKQMTELNKLVQDDTFWHEIIEGKKTRESLTKPPLMALDLKSTIEWDKVEKQFSEAGYTNNRWYDEFHFKSYGNDFANTRNDINSLVFIHTLNSHFNDRELPSLIEFIKVTKPDSIKNDHKIAILELLNGKLHRLNKARQIFSLAIGKPPALQFSKEELDKMKRKTQFPVIFATTEKLNVDERAGNSNLGEKLYEGNLTLGKQLKLIITNSESEGAVRQYLKQYHLSRRVRVCTYDEFKKEQEKIKKAHTK